MSEHRDRPISATSAESLHGSPEAWMEMMRTLGIDRVTLLLRTPLLLKAELTAAEERMRGRAGQRSCRGSVLVDAPGPRHGVDAPGVRHGFEQGFDPAKPLS